MARMMRSLVVLFLAPALSAQFLYDFNSLSGSDTPPFTPLTGQDNWTEETYNAPNPCGVTQTLSHDGTPCLQFQQAGPGYGCDASRIVDGTWVFPQFVGNETNAMFQVDMRVGFWGGSFGLGYDTNGDTTIRGNQAGERGVRFSVGTQSNQQLRLYAADQTFVQVPLSTVGINSGDWLRVRVIMDLTAGSGSGLGSLFVQNLTAGELGYRAVPGLLDVPLALDLTTADASNPALWHAVWLHFEGATYAIDNIDVGRGGSAIAFGTSCDGAAGPTELRANGSFDWGSTVMFESDNHQAGAIGLTTFGFSSTTSGGIPLPLLLDPFFGTNNCFQLCDIAASTTVVASPTGVLSQPFLIPNGVWTGFAFLVQQACLEAVPGGLSTTNALRVQLP